MNENIKMTEKQAVHEFYNALIEDLPTPDDTNFPALKKHLKEKNLPDEFIDNAEYRSIHISDVHNVVYNILEGTPEIKEYRNKIHGIGEKGKWIYNNLPYYIIPLYDEDKKIHSLKARALSDKKKPKMFFIKSSHIDKKIPTYHIPKYCNLADVDELIITEGEKKADYLTWKNPKLPAISIGGVAQFNNVSHIFDRFTNIKKIYIAFDADVWNGTTPYATASPLNYIFKMRAFFYEKKIENVILRWDISDGKGIDDFICNGGKFEDIENLGDDEIEKIQLESKNLPQNTIYFRGKEKFYSFDGKEFISHKAMANKLTSEMSVSKILANNFFQKYFSFIDTKYEPLNSDKIILDADGGKYYNIYSPSKLKIRQGDVSPFLNHLNKIFRLDEVEIILDFLAHNVQKPGVKIKWALILQGDEGIGKSWLGEIIRECVGQCNVSTPSSKNLQKEYTKWAYEKTLSIFEDLGGGYTKAEKKNLYEKLKPIITDKYYALRAMYSEERDEINTINIIAFTNHKDAVILDDKTRRFCVVHSDFKIPKNKEGLLKSAKYFEDLYKWTEQNYDVIYTFLKERDLSNFKYTGRAPETIAMEEVRFLSSSDKEDKIISVISDEDNCIEELGVVALNDISELLMSKYTHDISAKSVGIIASNKYGIVQRNWRYKGKKRTFYDFTPEQKWVHKNIDEVKEHLDRCTAGVDKPDNILMEYLRKKNKSTQTF